MSNNINTFTSIFKLGEYPFSFKTERLIVYLLSTCRDVKFNLPSFFEFLLTNDVEIREYEGNERGLYINGIIYVRADLPLERFVCTILHEELHAYGLTNHAFIRLSSGLLTQDIVEYLV